MASGMSSTRGSGVGSRTARFTAWIAAAACTVAAVLLTLAITAESTPGPSTAVDASVTPAPAEGRFVPIVATVTPTVSIPDLCDASYCDAFGDPFSHASCTLNTLICGGPEVTPAFSPP
jgi:hypothetical protein